MAGSNLSPLLEVDFKNCSLPWVIMDMIMPYMGGGVIIERIKLIDPEVRIILSSGYSLNSEAQEIFNRGGVQAFLQKPFQMEELAAKINEVRNLICLVQKL